jgi:DNA repair exonuclease SbcCD ATPase subunit
VGRKLTGPNPFIELRSTASQLEQLRQSLHTTNVERSAERAQLTQQLLEAKERLRVVEEEGVIFKKRLEEMTEERDKHVRELTEAEEEAKRVKSSANEEREKLLRELKDMKADVRKRNFISFFYHTKNPFKTKLPLFFTHVLTCPSVNERSDKKNWTSRNSPTSLCSVTARPPKLTYRGPTS